MAGNNVVRTVGSVMFLAAITGLLSPPSPPQLPPPPTPRRGRAAALPRHRISATVNFPGGSFDPDAWRGVAAGSTGGASSQPASPEASSGGASVDGRGEESVDLDVEKLPTFAFFVGNGGRLREDVVGESNARSCGATLQNKLGSLWGAAAGKPPSQWSQAGSPTTAGKEDVVGGDGGGGGGGVGGSPAGNNRDAADFGGIAAGLNADDNIIELISREDLRRIVSVRREEQGPVVVMYHASWCRKCAYLTPVFRRLARGAALEVAGGDHEDGGGDSDSDSSSTSSGGPVFCRVDVSTWGKRATRVATDGGRSAANGEGQHGAVTSSAAEIGQTRTLENGGGGGRGGEAVVSGGDGGAVTTELLHSGSPAMENCDVCGSSGFVACGECEGRGAVARSSSDGKHTLAVTCPACVGYKRLRCPSCGGKCYMCD